MNIWKPRTLSALILVFTLILFAVSGCGSEENDTSNNKKAKSGYSSKNTEYTEVVFSPYSSTRVKKNDMNYANKILKTRLKNLGISDYNIDIDEKSYTITVKFPKPDTKDDYDSEQIIDTLSESAVLGFYEGTDNSGEPFLTGDDVDSASSQYTNDQGWVVSLKLNSNGADAFYKATGNAAANGTKISIYLDDKNISIAGCEQAISGGEAVIYGNFTEKSAKRLAEQINAGALPFALMIQSITGDD